jgi:hypothetical protein
MGVECHAYAEGVDSPIQDFAGPIILADHQGWQGPVGCSILVDSRGRGTPTQEGPPLVFLMGDLSVCM